MIDIPLNLLIDQLNFLAFHENALRNVNIAELLQSSWFKNISKFSDSLLQIPSKENLFIITVVVLFEHLNELGFLV